MLHPILDLSSFNVTITFLGEAFFLPMKVYLTC
jgi:hypothetical protein